MNSLLKLKNWFLKHIWLILITGQVVFGLGFLAGGFLINAHADLIPYDFLKSVHTAGFLKAFGVTMLSSGTFAVTLKAFQFAGVFKDELITILYRADQLKHRNDIKDIWKDVSTILYDKEFTDISSDIQDIILQSYFPSKATFYYEDFEQTLEYKELNSDRNLWQSNETITVKVKTSDPKEELIIPYRSESFKDLSNLPQSQAVAAAVGRVSGATVALPSMQKANRGPSVISGISDPSGDPIYSFVLEKAEVNFESRFPEVTTEDTEDGQAEINSFNLSLQGSKEYEVRIEMSKIFCLDYEDRKDFSSSRFINNFRVDIQHPEKLNIKFYPVGTHGTFIPHRSSATFITKKYKGLIFPKQGYRLILTVGKNTVKH